MTTRLLERYFEDVFPDREIQKMGLSRDKVIEQFVAVDITDVSRWFYEENEQEQYDIGKDFPSVVTPWPFAWFEFQGPKQYNSEGRIIKMPRIARMAKAARVATITVKDEWQDRVLVDDPLPALVMAQWPDMLNRNRERQAERKRWLHETIEAGTKVGWMAVYTFFEEWPRWGLQPLSVAGFYVDDAGVAIGNSLFVFSLGSQATLTSARLLGIESVRNAQSSHLFPFLFAISLLHCKNVQIVETPLAPVAVRKAREKKGQPTIRYKTLEIEPMRKQVRRECNEEDAEEHNQIKRALHICRGHFKDYRESGLFGKYYDIYWWDMHVRGDAAAGKVVKDYEIKAPVNV